MPELPEVEVSRRGLLPFLPGKTVRAATLRTPRLRHEIPPELPALLAGRTLIDIARRGKYLLFDFGGGWLILHLGMSGSLRLVAPGTPPQKHDHFDLEFADTVMRLRDPRRFGALVWTEAPPERHPLLAALGIEPLSPDFDGRWLHAAFAARKAPVKPVLMDGRLLVGVGNIYASESLFRAGISPLVAACRIGAGRCDRLATAIRQTLAESIAAGGSSVRDYVHSDGGAGCFQLQCAVYDRAGEACPTCGTAVKSIRQAGRSTFWCPRCQR
ncbi:MAG: bifunctional DNA-formamidopyrimidine glycosylase/DNA-(apurinic or apyrimidinic site) lyase [Azospira sp.]|jgi:formamidopyrimidine-DNA glycosylase|nr:bifunctional DNA-formamidopyrimidine glycosylase/DNA-(apurinic or apyrimidinic site) lyase [Azospira sp.]